LAAFADGQRRVLAAVIGMVDHAGGRPPVPHRHLQGCHDQLRAQVCGHGPPDPAPADHIADHCQIEEALPGRHIRTIGYPEPIGGRGGERARNTRVLTAFRRELGHAGLTPTKAQAHCATIHDLAQTTLLGQTPPRGLLDLRPTDLSAYLRTRRDSDVLISLRRFVRFLVRTERLGDERAEALRTLLK
jgi:hypothetical protein